MQIHNADVAKHIETLASCSVHTVFSDFPYFLGTEWHYVDGVLQMKGQGKDFMNGSKGSWTIQDANWWREYFGQMYRVMKYGGYVVFYSISQQSWAFSALMVEAGFEKCQELHWANISNFPKASDASKATDKRVGAEREVVGLRNPNLDGSKRKKTKGAGDFKGVSIKDTIDGMIEVTAPATELATLLNGYKYGKAPLKKITEPILVFRKPCKFGSVLNDLMACQSDPEISPAILDIERNRVGTEGGRNNRANNTSGVFNMGKYEKADYGGRFPATLFISPAAAELLDSQLDLITFELNGRIYEAVKRLEYQRIINLHVLNNTLKDVKVLGVKREVMSKGVESKGHKTGGIWQKSTGKPAGDTYGDSGDISRVLHQPDFTEADYASLEYAMNDLCQYSQGIVEDTVYMPTVSRKERHAGCEHLLYKGIETLLVIHTKKGKTTKSKVEFDTLADLELDSLGKSQKDKDKAICKIFFNLVCEASEEEITDSNFVEIAQSINQYQNEFGFFYLGNDTFKVFYQNSEFLIEAKNVIRQGNGHPTLKSIMLNKMIAGLFVLPKEFNQVVLVNFSGTGSEVIGLMLAGVNPENIISVELNTDYVAIQKARIKYFAEQSNIAVSLPKSENEPTKPNNKLSLF